MSYNKSLFQGVPKKKINKTKFNLSHEWKNEGLPGFLIPVLCQEVMPMDDFDISSEFMFRFDPLYYPIMQKMTLRCDYFYIPNRIAWPQVGLSGDPDEQGGWENWIQGLHNQDHPTVDANMEWDSSVFNMSVSNYFGLPYLVNDVGTTNTISKVNAFPFIGYLMCYDEYYRVPQLQDEITERLTSGDNTAAITSAFTDGNSQNVLKWYALPAKWEKDYFTSALPSPQVGEAIKVPSIEIDDDGNYVPQDVWLGDGSVPGDSSVRTKDGKLSGGDLGPADIMLETNATIRQLRVAEVLQSYYERMLKVGQRYRDFIKGFWEHDPQPGLVDVPVMFGSVFGHVQIADVMTTASIENANIGDRMTGDYTGQANLYNTGNKVTYFAREHGFIIAILQVNPNSSYGQGVHRLWRRQVPTDYPLDMFSTIGDQEVKREEVLYSNYDTNADDLDGTWGYVPRFSEMRYQNNIFGGSLQIDDSGTTGLSKHLGRFWKIPQEVASYNNFTLDEIFTEVGGVDSQGHIRNVDVFRTLPNQAGGQVPTEGVMKMHIFHSIYVSRALPLYSTPDLT